MAMHYERALVKTLAGRLSEPRGFIQIVVGPRQTGKSTAVSQALSRVNAPCVEFSFDRPKDQKASKLEALWEDARDLARNAETVVLSLDEVQKVPDWSSVVKFLWDKDTRTNCNIKVVLTGSSTLLLQSGMAESLKGRFEVLHSTQWTLGECREAFGYSLDDFLYFGGYPGAAALKADEGRWLDYMRNSIIEPTLTQDVLEMETVKKPALLRALFEVGAVYSAQEISYRKLIGQLDESGNTEVMAHYLELLSHAGLLAGLKKYDEKVIKSKSSSPRLIAYDTSLMTVASGESRETLLGNAERRGHVVETAVGAYLLARAKTEHFDVRWWRDRSNEVDFVVTQGRRRTAIEVKSGRVKNVRGLGTFVSAFPGTYTLIVGSDAFPLESFLLGQVPLFQ